MDTQHTQSITRRMFGFDYTEYEQSRIDATIAATKRYMQNYGRGRRVELIDKRAYANCITTDTNKE